MSLKTLPSILEVWTREDMSSLTTNEFRRLEVIMQKKLYDIEVMLEERILAPQHIREALEQQALKK